MIVILLTQFKKLYKNIKIIHASLSLTNGINIKITFSFEPITTGDILHQIKHTDINQAIQEGDTSTKLVKRFDNLIVDYLQKIFNNCLKTVPSLVTLKNLWFIEPIKRTAKRENESIGQLTFSLIYLKLMNDFYMTK